MLFPALLGAALWLVLRPVRRLRRAGRGLLAAPYREGGLLLLFMFAAGLLGLTLTPPGFWSLTFFGGGRPFPAPFSGEVNLTPFVRSLELLRFYVRHEMWSAVWINFPGNVVMFLPAGFFAGLLADKPAWWKSTLLCAIASLFIETFQLFVARGTDIDDLILNTLGGLLGHGLYALLARLFPDLPAKFQCVKVDSPHG